MAISVRNISKQYGTQRALDDVSFEIGSGEVVGFLGPNGAGKSTLMKILTCFIPPTSGEASVCGFDTRKASMDVRRNVGYLPEHNPLYLDLYVHEYLELLYGDRYVSSPWLRFFAEGKWRWCQPDGLLFDPQSGRITIVEVKYQHTSDAWWQVRHLYQPVLQAMFPEKLWTFDACEIVKWYDPDTRFPEKLVLAQEISMKHPAFKVHIWRP